MKWKGEYWHEKMEPLDWMVWIAGLFLGLVIGFGFAQVMR